MSKHVKHPILLHCSPATWHSRIPVQWCTSSPIFLPSALGSLSKGDSSVHCSCLICCMLSLLLWWQKDFHWPQQDLELFGVLQVSDWGFWIKGIWVWNLCCLVFKNLNRNATSVSFAVAMSSFFLCQLSDSFRCHFLQCSVLNLHT